MALPVSFGTITVTGKYVDFTGIPAVGTVTFSPPSNIFLKVTDVDIMVTPKAIEVTLDVEGAFSVTLPLSDDPQVTPSFTYSVTESVTGLRRAYNVEIPSSLLPGPVDLSDLAPTGASVTGTTALTRLVADTLYAPIGDAGAVDSVNGQTGVVVLTAASVGAAATSHGHATADVTGLDTALAGKAPTSHTHTTANVTGLDAALAGKAAASHAHATSDVTGLDTALAGKAASSHTHTTAQVTGLDTALAGKASTAAASETAAGIVELATPAESRTGTDPAKAVTPAGMAGFAMKYVALSGVTLSGRFVVAPDGATYTGGSDKITGDIVATLAP
jgi:hypothetical protein